MSLREFKNRWEAEESYLWKKVKYFIGYSGMFGGVVLDMGTKYMPFVGQYIPETIAHWIFTAGLIAYGISKLSVKSASTDITDK